VGSGGQGLGPLVYAGIQPLVRLTWFTLRLGSYVGWKWPVALAVYFFASLGAETPFERAISLRTIMNIWFDDLSRQAQDSHFLEFSLCLSRACLGKIIVFICKLLKKAGFERRLIKTGSRQT
jgi:hypothetical protein